MRFGGGYVRVHHFMSFSESCELSASFFEQDQARWYVAGAALRSSYFLAYQGHQILVTNRTGDPERVLEERQGLVPATLPYQDIGSVIVRVRCVTVPT